MITRLLSFGWNCFVVAYFLIPSQFNILHFKAVLNVYQVLEVTNEQPLSSFLELYVAEQAVAIAASQTKVTRLNASTECG
jgi:hypothetical protein